MNDKEYRLEFAKRMALLCKEKDLPDKGKGLQTKLAKIFGISQNSARKWLEGEGWPTWDRIVQIAEWGNVTTEWLMTGKGRKRPSLLTTINDESPVYLSQTEKTLIEKIRLCTSDKAETVNVILTALVNQPDSTDIA